MENKRKRGLGRGLSALIGNEPIVAPQAEQEKAVTEKSEKKERRAARPRKEKKAADAQTDDAELRPMTEPQTKNPA